jgi:integrase/recombinase XerD
MELQIKSLDTYITEYLHFCKTRKNLDSKTTKSYSIDLRQYTEYIKYTFEWNNKKSIESYIEHLHNKYKPKSVKRKIASLKAFFHYLEIEEIIETNPFHKIQLKYKEPFILPKTIPINTISSIIQFAYLKYKNSKTSYSKKTCLRNALILELLFATGMRISELCSLTLEQIDFNDYIIKIYGKGSKERLIQICNKSIQVLLDKYRKEFNYELSHYSFFFINRLCNRLSEQSVRNMINNYALEANISLHITPHMFRHSFATLLLEEDVDIRYIQQMLGHSSITTTQIYTHTSTSKQKDILTHKHPRNQINIQI